jgi:hypothetical protein
MTPLASSLRLTLWSPATTSSHTSISNTRTSLMANSRSSSTRPLQPQPSTSLTGSRQRKLGTQIPSNKKIVVMTAALNALKGKLKLDPMLSIIATKDISRATTRVRKRRTRRACPTNVNRRRMRHGRKSHQRVVKSTKNRLASTLTIGVNTTWHGRSTSLLIAC